MQVSTICGRVTVQLETSRRERKKQATRQALHEAAFVLVEEHGLAAVTVEAIADRADVATRTFFNYSRPRKRPSSTGTRADRKPCARRSLSGRPVEDALTALRRVMEGLVAQEILDGQHLLRRMRLIRSEPLLRGAMAAMHDEIEEALVAAVAQRTGQDPDRRPLPGAGGQRRLARVQGGPLALERPGRAGGLRPRADRRLRPVWPWDWPTPEPIAHECGHEAPPGPPATYTHRQIMLIMSGLMMGLLLAALDQTIVTTALTTISRDFHRLDLYSWVVTAYLLTSTASTPLYGKLSDQFGRKLVFQIAVVIFLIGSVLSGLSQSMIQLILFRGVQGLGAGGLMTLAMAIVGDVIPPRERGRYQGYFGAVFGISSIIGPLIGGFLVDEASWRWVFYVNIPVGVSTLVVINRVLHLEQRRRKAKVDVLGSALIVSGVSLFLIGVQSAGTAARITTAAAALRRRRAAADRSVRVVGDQGGRAHRAAAPLPHPGVQRGQPLSFITGHGDVRGHDLPAAVFPAGPRHQPDPVGPAAGADAGRHAAHLHRLRPADLPDRPVQGVRGGGDGDPDAGAVLDVDHRGRHQRVGAGRHVVRGGLRARSVHADAAAGGAELDPLRGHGRRHRGGDLLPDPRRRRRSAVLGRGPDRSRYGPPGCTTSGVRPDGRAAAGLHPRDDDRLPLHRAGGGVGVRAVVPAARCPVEDRGRWSRKHRGGAGRRGRVEVGSAEGRPWAPGPARMGRPASTVPANGPAGPRGAPAGGPAASLEPPGF